MLQDQIAHHFILIPYANTKLADLLHFYLEKLLMTLYLVVKHRQKSRVEGIYPI